MVTRYDVAEVPPQGGHLARRCPVRAQLDVLAPCPPLEPSPVGERRVRRVAAFRASVSDELLGAVPGAVLATADDRTDRERSTSDAMGAGAALILGGRLPTDVHGRRYAEPDVLVRAAPGGYRAVAIEQHRTLESPAGGARATCSPLEAVALEAATPHAELAARRHRGDLLQLAHHQRVLEAAGMAADEGRWGGRRRCRGRGRVARLGRAAVADPFLDGQAEGALDDGGVRLRVRLPPRHHGRGLRAPRRSRRGATGAARARR